MNSVSAVTSVNNAQGTAPAYLDFLRATNPHIDELLAQQPGVRMLLDKADAVGAVARGPAAGEVVTPHKWSLWSHSPASGHLPENWRDEVIFVFQSDPNPAHTLQFGNKTFQGMIVGVFTKGQVFTDEYVTRDRISGKERGFSQDRGFEAIMNVQSVGTDGVKAGLSVATGMVDATGGAKGTWGLPSEWNEVRKDFGRAQYEGRQMVFEHGLSDHFPITDGRARNVLIPKPDHKPGEIPYTYGPYNRPIRAVTTTGPDPAYQAAAAKLTGANTPSTVASAPASNTGASPLLTRINNNS